MNQILKKQLLATFLFIVFGFANANESDSLEMESYFQLSDKYWNLEKTDSTFFFINNAIQVSKDLGYPERTGKFMLNKARVFYDDSQVENTFKTIEEAISVYREANIESGEPLALLYKGYFHEEEGEYGKAIITYKNGAEISKQIKDTTMIGTLLNNLSVAYHALGDNESAINYLIESIHYRESENSPNIGISYANLGNAYKRQENYKEAISWYQKSFKALQGEQFAKARIICLRNMGDTYTRMHKYELAEEKLRASYEIAKQLGNSNGDFAMYHFFMGSLYLKQGNNDFAMSMFKKANELFPNNRNFIFRGNSYIHLTEIYLSQLKDQPVNRQQLLEKAIESGEFAMGLAEQSGVVKQVSESAKLLMKVYGKAQNSAKSLQYANLYGTTLDSLNKIESSKKVIELQTKFEVEKKELQIELLGKENDLKEAELLQSQESEQQQQQITLISLVALIISVLSALFLYRLYGQKKKATAFLETKNAVISEQKEKNEILLKEIHHRVKNNLQVISSLLDLQSDGIADETALSAVEDGQSRVKAMALIHQNLYQNQDIGSIPFEDYADQLIKQLADVYSSKKKVGVELKSNKTLLDIDTAIPLGLILNELISNAYKYAFDDEIEGKLKVQLDKISEGEYQLQVSDNGKGLANGFDIGKAKSLGLRLVRRLSKQLYGSVEYTYNQGAIFSVIFKDTNQRKLVQ